MGRPDWRLEGGENSCQGVYSPGLVPVGLPQSDYSLPEIHCFFQGRLSAGTLFSDLGNHFLPPFRCSSAFLCWTTERSFNYPDLSMPAISC